jgi:hypothetical protein
MFTFSSETAQLWLLPGYSIRRFTSSSTPLSYNFCSIHGLLRVTPAMAAAVTYHVWEMFLPWRTNQDSAW